MPTIYKPPKKYQKNETEYQKERQAIYNSARWRRLSAWKKSCDPLCEDCLAKGVTTPTEDVHHIVSFMSTDDPGLRLQLAYDFDNLLSLCDRCHQLRHNKSR